MKLSLKKIIIILIILCITIFLIFCIPILRKYIIAKDILNKYAIYSEKENYYFYCYNTMSENITQEVWKKDDIIKATKTLLSNPDNTITTWKNTNEQYALFNLPKQYTTENVIIPTNFPTTAFFYDEVSMKEVVKDPKIKFKTVTYEGKDCYYIDFYGKEEEYIEKETGILLYSKNDIGERKITYSFDTVTDADIQKPDLTGYTIIE